jgi:hypothetical protein
MPDELANPDPAQAIAELRRRRAPPTAWLDLSAFGCETVALTGTLTIDQRGGRMVFLMGENHTVPEMKMANVRNALKLIDAGVVGCAGTEIPLPDHDPAADPVTLAAVRRAASEGEADERVMQHLYRHWRETPPEYQWFEFGTTLRALRPDVPVFGVESPEVRARTRCVDAAYKRHERGEGPHPFPEFPAFIDHPVNAEREGAMFRELVALWERTPRARGAILNTGSAHCRRLAGLIQAAGYGCVYVAVPDRTRPRGK